MTVTREKTLEMLQDYLKGKINKQIVHQWALEIVKSDEFDKIQDEDDLLSEAIHALFDLHHEGEEEKFNPTTEELEYYKNCLEGKIQFNKTR